MSFPETRLGFSSQTFHWNSGKCILHFKREQELLKGFPSHLNTLIKMHSHCPKAQWKNFMACFFPVNKKTVTGRLTPWCLCVPQQLSPDEKKCRGPLQPLLKCLVPLVMPLERLLISSNLLQVLGRQSRSPLPLSALCCFFLTVNQFIHSPPPASGTWAWV
jgi:hypothetical protein